MLTIWKSLLKNKIGAFAQNSFSFLLLFYLVLFILENLFPGFVSNSFDLNILLIPLFATGILSAFFPAPQSKPKPTTKQDYAVVALLVIVTGIIVFTKTQDLGGVSFVLAFVSSVLVLCISLVVLFTDAPVATKQLPLPIVFPDPLWKVWAKRLVSFAIVMLRRARILLDKARQSAAYNMMVKGMQQIKKKVKPRVESVLSIGRLLASYVRRVSIKFKYESHRLETSSSQILQIELHLPRFDGFRMCHLGILDPHFHGDDNKGNSRGWEVRIKQVKERLSLRIVSFFSKNKIIGVFVFFIILRLLPYIQNRVPTGYDGGIYIHVIKFFPSMPSWLVPQYYSLLFFLTYPSKLLGISAQSAVVPLAILLQVLLLWSMYWVVKKISGKQTAVVAAFILSVSAIQMRTYWFFYVKYILSCIFLLYYLYFQGKKSYVRASVFGVLVGTTHLLTFGILLVGAGIDIFITKTNRKGKIIVLAAIVGISCLFYLPNFRQTIIANFIPTVSSVVSLDFAQKDSGGGTFYPIYISILLTAVYLPLAVYGMFKTSKEEKETLRPFFITLLVTIVLVVIKASFFRRIFIITDLMLIVYASFGFGLVWDIKKYYIGILIVFAVLFTLKTSDKLISNQNVQEISRSPVGKNFLVSTAKEDTAWLLGYTDAKVIAWGYGGYNTYWTNSQWNSFLSKNVSIGEKRKLLLLLPKSTYVYVDDATTSRLSDLLHSTYLKQISPHFYVIKGI